MFTMAYQVAEHGKCVAQKGGIAESVRKCDDELVINLAAIVVAVT